MSNHLDPKVVRHLFDYADGVLFWTTSPAMKVKAGTPAGSLHKKSGRVAITIKGQKLTRARLVWAWHHGTWPDVIQHRNDVLSDDRIENLRNTSNLQLKAEAAMARAIDRLPGTTKKHNRNWQAQICDLYIGSYPTAEQAHAAFLQAYEERNGTTAPYTLEGGIHMSAGCSFNTPPPPPFFIANGILPADIQGAGE
jgi:hypothetical protein